MLRIILIGFLLALPGSALAGKPDCRADIQTPFLKVGLYDSEALGRLENGNQLASLCAKDNFSAACVEQALMPTTKTITVHETPGGALMGTIMVVYTPAKGMTVLYAPGKKGGAEYFEPDSYDVDWGYGPHFHQTAIAREGDWYRLALPQDGFGWVERKDANLEQVQKGDYVSLYDSSYVVLEVRKKTLLVRDEQEGEVCPSKPVATFEAREVTLDNLYDQNCRLILRPTYPRGC